MSTDKEQATRLADALESITYFNGKSETRDAAVQMLRRWPDAGEPVAHQYLFDGYYGPVWRNDSGPWNGMQPKDIRPLYTAPPAERIAALEAENAEWRRLRDPQTLHANLLRGLPAQLTLEQRRHLAGNDERIAALEAALEQTRADMVRWYEAGYPYGVTIAIDRINALRKIGEVKHD